MNATLKAAQKALETIGNQGRQEMQLGFFDQFKTN